MLFRVSGRDQPALKLWAESFLQLAHQTNAPLVDLCGVVRVNLFRLIDARLKKNCRLQLRVRRLLEFRFERSRQVLVEDAAPRLQLARSLPRGAQQFKG